MSTVPAPAEAGATSREQLRTFHIAGWGLELAIPASPLRPLALDDLPQLPPFESEDLISLYTAAVTSSRGKARAVFLARIKQAREQLREMLALDDSHSPEASTGENISAALGREAGLFFNTDALADVFHTHGQKRMEPERKARIDATIATLDAALRENEKQPLFWSFDNSQEALEFSERQLDQFAGILRALRTARIECESAFDPAVHVEALNRFDWQAADASELLALPPVLVRESAERLAQSSLTSFGRVLRSGRPIQILVTSAGFADDLSGFIPDFGYLAMAHREAFVLQSSMSRPDHLTAGLAEMTGTLRPAVAIVSVPAAAEHDARLATSLLYLSRAFPLFRYDPDRGETWPNRFELLVDQEPYATAADAFALLHDFRRHFRIIPANALGDEQMELSEYLKRYTSTPPLAIPFIWVASGNGTPQRAAVTRELVNLCRDRNRAWKTFEELAGVNNAAVHDGAERDEKARLEGAKLAINRVVAMLTGPVAQVFRPVSPQSSPTPPPSTGQETCATAEPYIESFLCTSCKDCFKINPRLFACDGNKQAFIADPSAGTFAELVKAAEACPARCIHPGTPRPDDPTAMPQLVAKAAKLTASFDSR
jgi:hypothetical protein